MKDDSSHRGTFDAARGEVRCVTSKVLGTDSLFLRCDSGGIGR